MDDIVPNGFDLERSSIGERWSSIAVAISAIPVLSTIAITIAISIAVSVPSITIAISIGTVAVVAISIAITIAVAVSISITITIAITVAIAITSIGIDSNEFVDGVEVLSGGTVEVEPPVAHQVLLVEDGTVGAEEGVLLAPEGAVLADVEDLAASFIGSVGVIARDCLVVAGEASVRDGGQDGVVFSRDTAPRDALS